MNEKTFASGLESSNSLKSVTVAEQLNSARINEKVDTEKLSSTVFLDVP